MFKKFAYQTLIGSAVLSLALAFSAGPAGAQTKCGGKDQPPCKKATGCSPGFYKHHLTFWVGICCNDTTTDPSCAELLTALTCKGSDASCGRSAAAHFLDACTGCSE